jgi:hypothetical protein
MQPFGCLFKSKIPSPASAGSSRKATCTIRDGQHGKRQAIELIVTGGGRRRSSPAEAAC